MVKYYFCAQGMRIAKYLTGRIVIYHQKDALGSTGIVTRSSGS